MWKLPVPPEELRNWVGPFQDAELFLRSGRDTVALARSMCSLRPEDAVLDVGCGSGRVALALTSYLSPVAKYLGFDVAPAPIHWCREHIEAQFPNFQFVHVDVLHADYNPKGTLRPEQTRFPCPSGSIDVVLASSVLTHLLASAAERYVGEIARVLRPGGCCLISYLLMDDEARRAVTDGTTVFDFRYQVGPAFSFSVENPTEGVAYPAEYALSVLHAAGLKVVEVRRGNWRKETSHAVQHDWVAARKAGVQSSPR